MSSSRHVRGAVGGLADLGGGTETADKGSLREVTLADGGLLQYSQWRFSTARSANGHGNASDLRHRSAPFSHIGHARGASSGEHTHKGVQGGAGETVHGGGVWMGVG